MPNVMAEYRWRPSVMEFGLNNSRLSPVRGLRPPYLCRECLWRVGRLGKPARIVQTAQGRSQRRVELEQASDHSSGFDGQFPV